MQGGGAGAVALDRAALFGTQTVPHGWRERLSDWAHRVDLTPDLGRDIGSLRWWRGLATCTALCGTMIAAAPGFAPVPGKAARLLGTEQFDQLRTQMVTPLAFGADTGGHMGPTDAVQPLGQTPERPTLDVDAVIGVGDSFTRMLGRAGVGADDAARIAGLVGGAVDPASIEEGTRVHITLGRRASRSVPRPVDALQLRARLDLALEIARGKDGLALRRIPIAVDDTPLRIRGRVGGSLYASARLAGADPETIQSYLKVLAQSISIQDDLAADDHFDIIVAHRRAETGETETGHLLFAGLERSGGRDVNLMRWTMNGQDQWFDPVGMGERRGMLAAPVAGHLTSGFGMRFHPILGYTRMHQGVDFGAAWGSPIYAAAAGRVSYAGPHGGHGNYVRLEHGGGLGTGYAHMSRIAAYAGETVRQGQIIGYVGSSGLSTGPHLHYEVYRGGETVNPLSVKFARSAQLAGAQLSRFKSQLARLKGLPVGLPEARFGRTALATAAGLPMSGVGASRRLR